MPSRPDWLLVPVAAGPRCAGAESACASCRPLGRRVVVFYHGDESDLRPHRALATALRAVEPVDAWLPVHADTDLIDLGEPARSMALNAHSDRGVPLISAHSRWRREAMDKHGLDVALSIGRHAAERAKLAGICSVMGLHLGGGSADVADRFGGSGSGGGFRSSDPYDELRILGSVGIATLVGLAIASAQMGLRVSLAGPDGVPATSLAIRLHPGVDGWLAQGQSDTGGLRREAV